MTAQVLFFNVFSEKDPHLNAVEKAFLYLKFLWKLALFNVFLLHLESQLSVYSKLLNFWIYRQKYSKDGDVGGTFSKAPR